MWKVYRKGSVCVRIRVSVLGLCVHSHGGEAGSLT